MQHISMRLQFGFIPSRKRDRCEWHCFKCFTCSEHCLWTIWWAVWGLLFLFFQTFSGLISREAGTSPASATVVLDCIEWCESSARMERFWEETIGYTRRQIKIAYGWIPAILTGKLLSFKKKMPSSEEVKEFIRVNGMQLELLWIGCVLCCA